MKRQMHEAPIPAWKRGMDACVAVASLSVWLPLMVLIAIAIKVVSPGPVFFRQRRVGYRGKEFTCFKFRSMKVAVETESHKLHLEKLMTEDKPMTKLDAAGDARLIPLGRFFRATGLDELPQLVNVLRGEMSLVGPRPCTPYEFARYAEWQKQRVAVLPGLTGYWQVNGKNKTTFSEMIEMDIQYAERMSLALDIEIILKTLPTLCKQVVECGGNFVHAGIDRSVSKQGANAAHKQWRRGI